MGSEAAITRLSGDFYFDLPLPDATAACTEAVEGLGWPFNAADPNRIVSYADTATTQPAPKIEIELDDTGDATDVRIIGTDSGGDPDGRTVLIAELDRIRDAIKAAAETVEEQAPAPTVPSNGYAANGQDSDTYDGLPQPSHTVYVQKTGNGFAVAALVVGLVGLVLAMIPILFAVGWAAGITAFILGLVARGNAKKRGGVRKTMATWGVVLGIAAFGMGCVGYAIVESAVNDFNSSVNCIDNAQTIHEMDACNS